MDRKSGQLTIWHYGVSFLYTWLARVHRHFGIVYGTREHYVRAVSDYSRALAINPRSAETYLERGIILWRELGQAGQAIKDFTVALNLRPAWPVPLFFRALAHQETSDYAAAIHDLSSYLESGDRSWREDATRQLFLIRLIEGDEVIRE